MANIVNPVGGNYFPYCFLVKSSPVLLSLLTIGACASIWWMVKRRQGRRMLVWLHRFSPYGSILLIYGLASLSTNLNIGHRHLLPLYPPLFVLSGAVGRWLWLRSGWTRAGSGVLLIAQIAVAVGIHPHYLAYFNAFAGGPERGYPSPSLTATLIGARIWHSSLTGWNSIVPIPG